VDTARELTLFLRRELQYPRLLAAFDPGNERWCVYELRRRMSGGWGVPFALSDSAEVVEGKATVRQVRDIPELIYVHEVDGKYAEANGHLILAALRKQDRWGAKDIAADMVKRVQANRAKRKQASSDHFRDLAAEHRGLVAKAAEEMGL
jgi:hypothetical protein